MLTVLSAVVLSQTQGDRLREWGIEALQTLRQRYGVPAAPGYSNALVDGKPNGVLFNWGVGVLMSAMNAAARTDLEWKRELARFVEATRSYWNFAGPKPGYDVLPVPKDADRYYDDNAWMVLALVEAHEVLGDPRVLQYAREALAFCLSGEDEKLGGGIYWREKEKASKNTCSNAPVAAACLAVYDKTRDERLLATARRIYEWVRKRLRDPKDGLMWDSMSLDGKVDETKWSYNAALMLRTAGELARVTGEQRYRDEAEAFATSAERKWIVDGRLTDAGRFAHLLVDAFRFLPNKARDARVANALEWLHEHARNAGGLYGGSFSEPVAAGRSHFELIDQASAARAFLIAGA